MEPGEVSIHDDRWLTYPWGVNGGSPGQRSRKTLVHLDGSEDALPSKCDRIQVEEGEILYFDTWGGGGWGDPFKRPLEKVEFDVRAGLVSREGAARYGVSLNDDLSVNEEAVANSDPVAALESVGFQCHRRRLPHRGKTLH